MNVLLLSWCLSLVLFQYPGHVAGQLTAPPSTCPDDTFTFRCNVTGSGTTLWRVNGSSNLCTLSHISTATATCGPSEGSRAFTATPESGFGPGASGPFTSTLSATADPVLNGTLVECFGPAATADSGNRIGNSTIQVVGPPSAPILSCDGLSEVVSGAVNVTVSWTLSGGDSADFYLINITTNAPQTPYGGLLNITTGSITQHELTGFMAGYEYNITVRGVNCVSQEGRESEPLMITQQVPEPPSSCNITALLYNQSSGELLFIDMTWDPMPDQIDPEEACQGPRGNITQYQISFQTGSVVATENVDSARCNAGRCSYTFVPPSNPPSSYDSVPVAAVNVVGVGAARTCTTQTINTTNNLLTIAVTGVSSPVDAQLQCTFLSEFTGSAHCTVQYGTDPTYMNLPYSAESTETGTAGDSVSVVLRERLNSSTEYYYTVSAVSGNVTVRVQGTFTTPQYSCNLTELWNLPAANGTILSDVTRYPSCSGSSVGSAVLRDTTLNTPTVAYYNGTTPGSAACFVCDVDSEYGLNSTITGRVCQNNGLWSGSPIICVCRLPPQSVALIAVGSIALVIAIVSSILVFMNWLSYFYDKDSKLRSVIITVLLLLFLTVVGILVIIAMIIYTLKTKKGRKVVVCCDLSIRWTILSVFAVVLNATGLALCIAAFAITSNPPNGNACDPNWRSTRDGLTYSALAVSIVAYIFSACSICFLFYFYSRKNNKNMKKWEIVLLLIAAIVTVIGLVIWIPVAICYKRDSDETDGDETDGDETDGHPEKSKIKSKSHTRPDGSEEEVEMKDVKSEKAAGPAGEETRKQPEQNKASPGLMYAEIGPQVRSATVRPPSIDDKVPYTSLIHVQSTAKDPAGTPFINVDTTSLPHSLLDIPPPIPPQQFLADDTLLSPKLLESSEPQQSERDVPPPRPPKTHQEDAAPPPRPPKTHLHTAESRKKGDK